VSWLTYLHTESTVDLGNAIVVLPDNTELEDTLGNLDDVESLLVLGVGLQEGLEGLGELIQSLRAHISVRGLSAGNACIKHTCWYSGSMGRTMIVLKVLVDWMLERG
jgi:hypothetical protein